MTNDGAKADFGQQVKQVSSLLSLGYSDIEKTQNTETRDSTN
jgi:hypothetical protein